MQEHGSALRLVRAVTLPGDQGAYGIALSHNGEYLAVTENSGTALLSTARLIEGRGNPVLGVFTDGMSGTIETAFSADDAYLFVSDEVSAAVSVFNVSRALHHGFSAPGVNIGQVPVSFETVGMALSPDGHTLYATSEFTGQPGREGFSTQTGQLQAIAVRKAEQNPGEALVASVPAGCEPVRVVLSQNGGLAWVSARGSNALLAFDTRRLDSHPSPTLVADVPVGQEPVGLTFVDGGRFLLVAESARFASPQAAQTVGVVNVEAALSAENALVGSIPAGEFPRELAVDRQSHQVLLTNFDSDTVEIFSADVERFVPKSKGG